MSDTVPMMVVRASMRGQLAANEDPAKVMYDAVGRARQEGVTNEQLRQITGQLRDEGWLPAQERRP